MSTYSLLAGGYRPTFLHLTFDPSRGTLKPTTSPAPKNASWVELPVKAIKAEDGGEVAYTLSEDPDEGKAVSLKIGEGGKVEITGERASGGAAAHLHCMKDGSGVIAANYEGGTIVFFPTTSTGALDADSAFKPLKFDYPYGSSPPNKERQEASHPHFVNEGEGGKLYVCDLGSDRVWVVQRSGETGLEVEGWLQCPEGMGPRHSAFSKDGKHLYVLTEMGHTIICFSLSSPTPSYPVQPLSSFSQNICPPTIPSTHQTHMDAAEIVLSPTHPGTLYASNRWELSVNEKNPELPDLPKQSGDAVAIVLLNEKGDGVEDVKFVRTGCDQVRGMQVSKDGKYVALAGQEGGGVEIWEVKGERGEEWRLAGKDEQMESVTDFIWL